MFHVIEKYRLKNHPILGSDSSYGNNGFFIIPHHRIIDYSYNCQLSDGEGWEHISITLTKEIRKTGKAFKNNFGIVGNKGGVYQHREIIIETKTVERCPTWEEMCYIKNLFWDKEDCVVQFHPPESEYVSMHPYCLHLWSPTNFEMPMPDSILVGIKKLSNV